MRILTLLARHGTERYAEAIRDLRSMFANQMPEVEHAVLVIDNALPPGHLAEADGITTIGGDNAAWEFSAWDRGIEFIGRQLESYDFIHLATSAFRQLYVKYLDRFDTDMLSLMRHRPAAIGHVDWHNEPVVIGGCAVQCWLRSSFLLLPPLELRMLGSLVGIRDASGFFSGNPASPFRDDAPLSPAFRQNIVGWLTGAGTGQGTSWHSRFDLSAETLPFFERKTVAILNEQLLTLRLHATGCHIVDATWLATMAASSTGRFVREIPDWRVQLRERDDDPAYVSAAYLSTS